MPRASLCLVPLCLVLGVGLGTSCESKRDAKDDAVIEGGLGFKFGGGGLRFGSRNKKKEQDRARVERIQENRYATPTRPGAAATQAFAGQLNTLPSELAAAWNDATQPAPRRREILFDRWDECDASPAIPKGTDPAVAAVVRERSEACKMAQAMVVTFVQKNLGEGTPDAYPVAELEALNRRRKNPTAFAPYPPKAPAAPSVVGPAPPPTDPNKLPLGRPL